MHQLHSKKVKLTIGLLFLFVLAIGNYGFANAQKTKPEQELIVQFKSNMVELPLGLRTVSLLQPVSFLSSELQAKLREQGAETLSKAFPEFSLSDTLKISRTGEKVRLPDLSQIYVLKLRSDMNRKNALDSLQKMSEIIFIEPNGSAISQVVNPDDPRFDNPSSPGSGGEQWNLLNTGQNSGTNNADIDASEAWSITKGSSNTNIAIIDYGILSTHEDLSGKVTGDAISSDHGTHVAGIAAAKTDNGKGIAGIDWNAQIINEVIGGDPATSGAILSAINRGADIINSSFALCSNCYNQIPTPRYSTLVRRAYANAYKMNLVSAASMGNYNTSNVYYPVGFGQGMIAVGATNRNDTRWEWNSSQGSNIGNHIDVVAPGEDITSTINNGGYAVYTGTSMASPHIAGIAGLLLAKNSSLYNDDIEQLIRLSAEKVRQDLYTYNSNGWNTEMGHGRVNAHQALLRLQSPYVLNHHTATGGYVANVTQETKIFYDTPGLSDGQYVVKRNEVRKSVSFPYMSEVHVWGRGVATNGYSIANPNFAMGWNAPVSVTNNSAVLKTYVYEVWTELGQRIGWFPTSPSNATFAYTVHGKPGTPPMSVYLSGLSHIPAGTVAKYTAVVSNGVSPFSYQWKRNGINVGTNSIYYLPTEPTDSGPLTLSVTVTDANNKVASDNITVFVDPYLNQANTPQEFTLSENYPNPFNPTTQISYALPEVADVTITVYNIMGQQVATLVNTSMSAGFHNVNFDASNVSSGIYIARMVARGQSGDTFTKELKMQLIK